MQKHMNIDLETYSSIDLKTCGVHKYAEAEDFEILLFAYAWDNGPDAWASSTGTVRPAAVQVVDLAQGEAIPSEVVAALTNPAVIKHAYNAAFEITCLNHAGYPTPADQWRCTMVHALYCGYGGTLGTVCDALGVPQDRTKLSTGGALIRTFCMPQTPSNANSNRTRTLPRHEPDKWRLFRDYNARDVAAEMDVSRRLSLWPIPEAVQQQWVLDQQINARGVAVDRQLVQGALAISRAAIDALMEEARQISGLDNPKSGPQLKRWLEGALAAEPEDDGKGDERDTPAGQSVAAPASPIPDIRKDTVKRLLGEVSDETVRRMLEIRQELGKTSLSKYAAMEHCLCADGRVRGLFQFYGANRTGRWAGRQVQVHNLPQNHLPHLDYARGLVRDQQPRFHGRAGASGPGQLANGTDQPDTLRLVYGNVPDTLSQLLRTAFVPAPGCVFLVADFSAIEARILAWLAGEQWVLDVFRGHGGIYEATASQMFGVPLERIRKGNPEYELRQRGKVATLALGYQGGVNALSKMDTAGVLRDEEKPDIVRRWRMANRRIVDFWYAVENAAITCLQTGQAQTLPHGLRIARESHHGTDQDFMTIALPSGRKLFYSRPRLVQGKFGPAIRYMGNDQKTKKWAIVDTYGGKLAENITQAVARDCLALAMERLAGCMGEQGPQDPASQAAGYAIVMHIHDEVVIESPVGTALEPVLAIMGQPIPWAAGLPLKAEGFISDFYRKG